MMPLARASPMPSRAIRTSAGQPPAQAVGGTTRATLLAEAHAGRTPRGRRSRGRDSMGS